MNRRELLKLIAIATGLPLIGADVVMAAENAAKQAGGGHVFSPEEIRFLDEVAETIIPRTSTPGAKDAEVGAFMAVYAADCYTDEQRTLFLSAIPEIEKRSQAEHKKAFLELLTKRFFNCNFRRCAEKIIIQKKKNIEHWLTLHAQPGCGIKFMMLSVMRNRSTNR